MSTDNAKWEDPVTDLDAVEATGAGNGVVVGTADAIRILITGDNSADLTVLIKGNTRADGTGTDVTLDTEVVSTDTTVAYEYAVSAMYPKMFTDVSAYTAGDATTEIARHI